MTFSLPYIKLTAVVACCALSAYISYKVTSDSYKIRIEEQNLEVLQLKQQVEENLVNSFVEVYDNADEQKEQLKRDFEKALSALRDNADFYIRNHSSSRLSKSTDSQQTVSSIANHSAKSTAKTTNKQLTENDRAFREELLRLAHQCDLNAVQNNALIDLLQKERESQNGN